MKVFAYPRVSTDEQAEKGNSLSEQQERITAYCRVMDWDEPEWFIEDGYSAKDTRRPKLTQLLEAVKNYKGEGVVITTKLDRLSRNLYDILGLTRYLEKHNFRYVSATESFDTSTAAGRLTLQVLGMVAEFERERNSERVRDNMLSIARKIEDNMVISRPCFGYDVINGRYEISIEESLNIVKMAESTLNSGPRATVRWLNEQGVLTKEGNEWNEKTLRELMRRETLVGDFVYNKTYRKGRLVIKRPPEEWIIVEDHHPAILDRETFRKLQQLFEANKTVGRRIHEDRYLLSGLVRCGHCGESMNGKRNVNSNPGPRKGAEHFNYVCNGYIKKAKCFYHAIERDTLEKAVIRRIKQIAKNGPGKLQLIVSKPKQKSTLERDAIIAKLERLDRRIQKQLEAYEDDLISADDLKKARERVDIERDKLNETLKEIEEGTGRPEEQSIVNEIKRVVDELTEDRLQTKQSLRKIIDRIKVSNKNTIDIVWKNL